MLWVNKLELSLTNDSLANKAISAETMNNELKGVT